MRCTLSLDCASLRAGVGDPYPPGLLGLLVRSDSAATRFFGILGDLDDAAAHRHFSIWPFSKHLTILVYQLKGGLCCPWQVWHILWTCIMKCLTGKDFAAIDRKGDHTNVLVMPICNSLYQLPVYDSCERTTKALNLCLDMMTENFLLTVTHLSVTLAARSA